MDLSALANLEPAMLRMVLPGYLAQHLAVPEIAKANKQRIATLVAGWSDDQCRDVVRALTQGGDGYRVFPADPTCRQLSREWNKDAILDGGVRGLAHLRDAAVGPTVVLCNHFAYYDATATDSLLAYEPEGAALANRLLYAAGPKVYTHLFRRVAASCLNTVKVPQSVKLSHTDRLSARQLMEQARSSLDATRDAVQSGLIPLLYPEGTRTRSGRMGSFLKGVHRYLSMAEEMAVVPAAITGTDKLMPVENDERIVPSAVSLTFAPPLRVGLDGTPKDILAASFHVIAELLPEEHKPEPGTEPVA